MVRESCGKDGAEGVGYTGCSCGLNGLPGWPWGPWGGGYGNGPVGADGLALNIDGPTGTCGG